MVNSFCCHDLTNLTLLTPADLALCSIKSWCNLCTVFNLSPGCGKEIRAVMVCVCVCVCVGGWLKHLGVLHWERAFSQCEVWRGKHISAQGVLPPGISVISNHVSGQNRISQVMRVGGPVTARQTVLFWDRTCVLSVMFDAQSPVFFFFVFFFQDPVDWSALCTIGPPEFVLVRCLWNRLRACVCMQMCVHRGPVPLCVYMCVAHWLTFTVIHSFAAWHSDR